MRLKTYYVAVAYIRKAGEKPAIYMIRLDARDGNQAGRKAFRAFSEAFPGYSRKDVSVSWLMTTETAENVAASPAALDACKAALPIVQAACSAMGEACSESDAEVLHRLRTIVADAEANV